MSLTAVTDVREIIKFHFGESMLAASSFGIAKGRLADVGSGAGFPGLPLRMISPDLNVTLIESNAKKTAFLAEVIRRIQVDGVEIFKGRSEDMDHGGNDFDFMTSRAVGRAEILTTWAERNLKKGGKAIFWVVEDDINNFVERHRWTWLSPVKIPESKRRVILAGIHD